MKSKNKKHASKPASAPKALPAPAKPASGKNWWEGPDKRLHVQNYCHPDFHTWNVECNQTRLGVSFIVGTVAFVVDNKERNGDWVVATTNAESLAEQIAADPSILDTLNHPNVLDCRAMGRDRMSHGGIHRFCAETCKLLELMDVEFRRDAMVVVLPDGTKRRVYQVSPQSTSDEYGAAFLGEIVADEPEAEVEAATQTMKGDSQCNKKH